MKAKLFSQSIFLFRIISLIILSIGHSVITHAQNNSIDAEALYNTMNKNTELVLFHGLTSEPWWDVFITEKEVIIKSDYGIEAFLLDKKFDINKKEQTLIYLNSEGIKCNIILKNTPAYDMADRKFPYSLKIDGAWGVGDTRIIDIKNYPQE